MESVFSDLYLSLLFGYELMNNMKTDKITDQQRKALFAFHTFIAESMNEQGITLAQLVAEIQPRPTKDTLHALFKSILESMHLKDTTKSITREEMSNVLDVYMDALAMINLHIPFPDQSKRTLLEFYN